MLQCPTSPAPLSRGQRGLEGCGRLRTADGGPEQRAALSEPELVLCTPGAWWSKSHPVGALLGCFQYESPGGSYRTGTVCAGPVLPRPVAMTALMESMASTVGNTVSALQLPRTWLDGAILGRVLAHSCPSYLNISRCSSPGFNPLHVLLSTGRDLKPLKSLNLRGCGRGPLAESCGKGEEEMDAESVKALTECCPHLIHLNLSATHYHHALPAGQDGHLCGALGRLAALCSLALPVCALAHSPPAHVMLPSIQDSSTDHSSRSLLLGLKKSSRIGVPHISTRNRGHCEAGRRAAG